MSKKIKMYRSIGMNELATLFLGIPVDGNYNPLHIQECGNNGYYGRIVCAFEDEVKWKDDNHNIFITIEIDESRIVAKGKSVWYMPKSFSKTKTYCGKRGSEKWVLNEYYLKQYSILDVVNIEFLNESNFKNYSLLRSLIMTLEYLKYKSSYLETKDYSNNDVLEKYNELINVFPNENTFVKKEQYQKALFRLLHNSFNLMVTEKSA